MNTIFKRFVWIAFYTLLSKELKRIIRIWPQTILPSVITSSLYFIIFGNIIGKRIGSMGGFDYTMFVIPGLVMMSVITNSYVNVASSFFGSKFCGSIEEVLVAPVPEWVLLLSYVMGGVIRGMIVATLVMLVSMVFTSITVYSWSITVMVMLITAFIFSMTGFLNGLLASKFDDVNIIPTFILTPLSYLGGVFYSISALPPFWQKISYFNPVIYEISAFRFGILGYKDGIDIIYTLTVMIIIAVLLFVLCIKLLKLGKGLKT